MLALWLSMLWFAFCLSLLILALLPPGFTPISVTTLLLLVPFYVVCWRLILLPLLLFCLIGSPLRWSFYHFVIPKKLWGGSLTDRTGWSWLANMPIQIPTRWRMCSLGFIATKSWECNFLTSSSLFALTIQSSLLWDNRAVSAGNIKGKGPWFMSVKWNFTSCQWHETGDGHDGDTRGGPGHWHPSWLGWVGLPVLQAADTQEALCFSLYCQSVCISWGTFTLVKMHV